MIATERRAAWLVVADYDDGTREGYADGEYSFVIQKCPLQEIPRILEMIADARKPGPLGGGFSIKSVVGCDHSIVTFEPE